MDERVLIVDDDINFLSAVRRQLRKDFQPDTAQGPEEGLNFIKTCGPYAVIISDLQMPKMNGIEFLSKVKEIAPDTVRMMLTGNADLDRTIQAVNAGNIFQFLTKPCAPETLTNVIHLGIKQYRLVIAEKELLQKTLKGIIALLNEVLSLVNPEAFGRSSRIRQYVKRIAENMDLPNVWWLEMAAMLSQIGCVILSEETLKKLYRGEAFTGEESQMFDMHPMIASDLISKIPRMEKVAEVIRYQEKCFNGTGNPKDNRQGKDIPVGARILKAVIDFDLLEARGISKPAALKQLYDRTGKYDPEVLYALETFIEVGAKYKKIDVLLDDLKVNMIFEENVRSKTGRLLISRGNEISDVLLSRLNTFAQSEGIIEPISVLVPYENSE